MHPSEGDLFGAADAAPWSGKAKARKAAKAARSVGRSREVVRLVVSHPPLADRCQTLVDELCELVIERLAGAPLSLAIGVLECAKDQLIAAHQE